MADEKTLTEKSLEEVWKYAKHRMDDEIKKLYEDIFPSIFGDLPIAILKVVIEDEKFWKETIFLGIGQYIRSKKKTITEILNMLENDLFGKNNFGNNVVRQLLTGSIQESEQGDFHSGPIRWIRQWLESDDQITVLPTDDVKHSVVNIFLAIIFLLVLFLIFYLVLSKPKLNIGHSSRIIIENVFKNVSYNDKTATGGLIKSILNVVDSWVAGNEKAKLLKNAYILLNETNKIAKSLNYLNTSLANEYSDKELADKKYKIRNKRINSEVENFAKSIGENAKKVFTNILSKGGLWKGESMDYILADMIFARVIVEGEGDNVRFKKRTVAEIIDWTDAESRKQHPLSKTIKNLNKISDQEISSSLLHNIYVGLFDEAFNKGVSNLRSANLFENEVAELYKYYNKNKLLKLINDDLKDDGLAQEIIKELSTSNDKMDNFKKHIKAIIEKFTFAHFYEIFKIDFVVTGSNITTAQPVYFNHSLTPTMSVVKAVRISSNFPILFQPIKLNHSEKTVNPTVNFTENDKIETWVKNKDSYYKKNYTGFFIDGGLLNNFPLNAFNVGNHPDRDFRDPKSMMELPPNDKVLALKLGGMEIPTSNFVKKIIGNNKLVRALTSKKRDARLDEIKKENDTYRSIKELDKLNGQFDRSKFKFNYGDEEIYNDFIKTNITDAKLNDKTIGMLNVVSKLYGSTMDNSMDGRHSAFYDKNEQVVRLYTGRISLFDLVTKESELDIVDLFSYSEIYRHFDILDQLPGGWDDDLLERLIRKDIRFDIKHPFKRNKWLKETRDRNRLRLKRRI